MAKAKVKLDHAGIRELLTSRQVAEMVNDAARSVARNIDSHGRPVDVRSYVTDRAAASVAIAHPAGMGMQAKYGTLTRAAAAAGLEVRGG